jgi:2-dehydropantoate 2-reductase
VAKVESGSGISASATGTQILPERMKAGSICSGPVDRVTVLGPGGVGGFIAGALARAGDDVLVVAQESTATLIGREGIGVDSVRLGRFTARPRAAATVDEPGGVLLVATKAMTLAVALERVRAQPDLVVPLLNGLDHMRVLRERFGAGHVAAGVIRIESDRPEPGRIVQTSPFLRVDVASDDPGPRPLLGELATMLERAGIPVRIETSEVQILWEKLVRLNALACTTSAADRPIGFIRSDPQWRKTLLACIDESAAVANSDGAKLDPALPLAELEDAHPELGSSMQRDIAAGREPELDAIAGAVLRAGRRHELECPTVVRLAAEIARRAGIPPPRY